MSYNKFIGQGNLARDPDSKTVGDKTVTTFSIAMTEKWKNKNGEAQESTLWLDCECWGRTAELAGQYLKKGSSVLVDGRLAQDTWDDKKTGEKRSKIKLKVDIFKFTGGNKSEDSHEETGTTGGSRTAVPAPATPIKPTASDGGGYSANEPPFMSLGYWG